MTTQNPKEAEINKELQKINSLKDLYFEIVDMGLTTKAARFYEHRITFFRGINFDLLREGFCGYFKSEFGENKQKVQRHNNN